MAHRWLRKLFKVCVLVGAVCVALLVVTGKAKANAATFQVSCPRSVTWTVDDAEVGAAPPGGDAAISASWHGIAAARQVESDAQVTYHWVDALAGDTGTSGVERDGKRVLVTLSEKDENRSSTSLRTVLARYARQARHALCTQRTPLSGTPTKKKRPKPAPTTGSGQPQVAAAHPSWFGNPWHAAGIAAAILLSGLLALWWAFGVKLLAVRDLPARLGRLRGKRKGTDDDEDNGGVAS